MKIEIISPTKKMYEGEAKHISLPAIDGEMGILNNHAPMITILKKGIIKIDETLGNIKEIETKGGTVEVLSNKVIILSE